MCHPRYCLTHHPGISSNTHHPLYPRWRNTHVTHTGTSAQKTAYVAHSGASLTLACLQREHTIHASTPPTQAHHPRHPRQHKQHAISQTPGYPINRIKNLAVFNFSVYFYSLYFQVFLSIFHRSLENRHGKTKLFQRKLHVSFL